MFNIKEDFYQKATDKYLSAYSKAKSNWHSDCGCSEPGLKPQCHQCPYFVDFVEKMQQNLPPGEEYPLISPRVIDSEEVRSSYYVPMYRNGYSIPRIAELLGMKSSNNIRRTIKNAGLLKTIDNATNSEKELVRQLYLKGISPMNIEVETGINVESIRDYVVKVGISRPKKNYSEQQKQEAIEMWLRGCSDKEIEQKFGITGYQVREYAKERGIKRTQNFSGRPSKYSDEIKQQCLRLRDDGKTYIDIQHITGVSSTRVSTWDKQRNKSK